MTTVTQTPTREVLPPPSERKTISAWLRRNLFSNWFNALLTILAAVIIFWLVRGLTNWALHTAEWDVIPANWNLLMRGQYPAAMAWRLWICIYLAAAVVGLSWGAWGRSVSITMLVVFAIPLLLMLLPWLSARARLDLLITEAALIGAFAVARFVPLPNMSRIAAAAWALFFLAIIFIIRGFGADTGPWTVVPSNLWGGLLLSLLLAFVGILFSFPLGVLLALGRQSKLPAIKLLSVIYIEFIRGVPLISLLFMAQVMLQLFLPASMPPVDRVLRAMVAIILFSAAYTAENVRGGLQSIPKGQNEAAQALGLNSFQAMTRIILPQALRAVIPVLVGQFIGLFKDTSLVALVGLFDLLGIARSILANPSWLGRYQEVFVVVALIYWIFSFSMSYASRHLETATGVGER
ncbi:MAG: amino acid ABC transporter permease [Caldilineaceae bacterium]|nr:amino acid ABC transporter permease [Caldilineaceae bacterium]